MSNQHNIGMYTLGSGSSGVVGGTYSNIHHSHTQVNAGATISAQGGYHGMDVGVSHQVSPHTQVSAGYNNATGNFRAGFQTHF